MAINEFGRYSTPSTTEQGERVFSVVTERGRKTFVVGSQTVSVGLLGGEGFPGYAEGYTGAGYTIFSPTLTQAAISIPLITRTGVVFAPVISGGIVQQVTPAQIANVGATFVPTVSGGIPIVPVTTFEHIPTLMVELDRDDLIEFGFILDDPVKSILDSTNTLDRVTVISWDEDITEWVRSGSTDRGTSRELERTEAGTGHLVLDNRDGRFTPFLPSGAYFPDILPLRRMRIQGRWNDVTYPIFQGFVESWPITFPGDFDNIVTVQLVDGFELLANSGAIVSGEFPEQTTGQRVEAVLLAAGFAPTEMSIETGVSTVAAVTLENANVLEHIQQMAHVEQGRFFCDRAGIFTFLERGPTGQPDFSTRTWTDAPVSGGGGGWGS